MNEDVDIDVEELLADPVATPAEASAELSPEEQAAAAKAAEADRFAQLETKIAELRGADSSNAKINELLDLGKTFLAGQKPSAPPAADMQSQLEGFGKTLREKLMVASDAEAAQFLLTTFNEISANNVNQALRQHGAPLADKAGDYATQMFLSQKRDDAGPNGEKLHRSIAKEFALSPAEREWVATAPAQATREFLDRKYTEAAGKVLIASSSRARPKDLGGGGVGGGTAGGGAQYAGVPPRELRKLQQLAEAYFPNDKKKQDKLIKDAIESAMAS